MWGSSRNNTTAVLQDPAAYAGPEPPVAANKTRHPLRLFYRSKSSEKVTSNGSSKKKDNKSDTSNGKKKRIKKSPESSNTNGSGQLATNESITFSSGSSGDYTTRQLEFSSHHPYHYHQQHSAGGFEQLASLPVGAVGDGELHYGQEAQSWRRSVSLRAPMVPMMIDDETELIDDDMDAEGAANLSRSSNINSIHYLHHPNLSLNHNHSDHHDQHHQQLQQQHHPQRHLHHHHHQQQQHRQYQHHQQQFLLSDESATEQCVDSVNSLTTYQHLYQNHPPLQQYHLGDNDGDEEASRYSQVTRGAHQPLADNYADRISHLHQKQQRQMMLASVLRQQQQHQLMTDSGQRAGLSSAKSNFSLGPQVPQQQVYNQATSSDKNQQPVAIYHQPNLSIHQQVRDLQRRFQPTPFSQTTRSPISSPPSTRTHSGPRSLSLVAERKLALRSRQQRQASSGTSSAGSQSATDSGALVGGQSGPSSDSNISAITSTSHLKLDNCDSVGCNGPDTSASGSKMQASGVSTISGSQHRLHQSNQHSSSTTGRSRSPAMSQSRKKPGAKSPPPPQRLQDQPGGERPALGFCGKFAKLLLFMSNILFWSAGIALGAWGILSLVDDHKYNLSQLLVFEPNSKMSLFQLLSWSFITLGCATILVGFCGCSAIFKNNRWILGLYIFLILAIFALDLATGLLAIIFQERLVANVRLRLANKLRSDYGVQASFTAAIDYIQTRYECCGLEGHFDYDQSLWRLQRLGGFEATVARTCCHLRNTFDDQAHVNPRPVNESMCQSSDVRFHQSYRYRKGCLDDLERLVRHKIWTFTIGCGAVGGVILLSLLFATCFCRAIPNPSGSRKSSQQQQQQQQLSHQNNKKHGGFILNHPHKTTNAQQQHQRQQYHR